MSESDIKAKLEAVASEWNRNWPIEPISVSEDNGVLICESNAEAARPKVKIHIDIATGEVVKRTVSPELGELSPEVHDAHADWAWLERCWQWVCEKLR